MARRAVFHGIGRLSIEQTPVPLPGAGEVVVEVAACGICGTDRSIFRGEYPIETPIVLGHEYSGRVVDAGPDVEALEIGQSVCIDPNITCGSCAYCRRGLTHLCRHLTPLGIARSGGFAQYSVVPAGYAYRIPDSLSPDEAALVEPLACSLRGIQQAGVHHGDAVVVIGAGAIGCLLLQLANIGGAAVSIAVEPNAVRRRRSLEFGASLVSDTGGPAIDTVSEATGGLGADIVLEASGTLAGAQLALDLVRRGGTVVWFGVYPNSERIEVSPYLVNENELTIRGSFNNPFTHSAAVALAVSGRVRLRELISDRIALEQLAEHLRTDAFQPDGKVIVQPNS